MTTKAAIALCVKQGLVQLPAPTTKSAEAIKAKLKRQKKSRYRNIKPFANARYRHYLDK